MSWTCPDCRRVMENAGDGTAIPVRCSHGASQRPEKVGQLARGDRWLSNSISVLVSSIVHTSLVLIFALVTCDYRPAEGPGEVILIGQLPEKVTLHDPPAGELRHNEPQEADQEQWGLKAELVPLRANATSGGKRLEEVALASLLEPAKAGAKSMGTAGFLPVSSSLGQGISFLGVGAQGRRFCILADRSGSMQGRKLQYVKEEILETLSGMSGGSRFQLVFFNRLATPFSEKGWRAFPKDRSAVIDWLASLDAVGHTDPTGALRLAFALKPLPDAIFLMTDGRFPNYVVGEVAALNRASERTVPVHTISFMDRSAARLLRRIAQDSGGTYRHVSGF